MSLAMEMETENSQNQNRRLLTMLKNPGLHAGGFASLMLALCLVSLSGCAWLDTKQRQLIYRPTPGVPAHFTGLRNGDEQFFLEVPAAGTGAAHGGGPISEATAAPAAPQRIEMWWLPNADRSAPTVLYLHGTFRTLVANVRKIEALRDRGLLGAGGGIPRLGAEHADHAVGEDHPAGRGCGLGRTPAKASREPDRCA
jgi:hypothetical protein